MTKRKPSFNAAATTPQLIKALDDVDEFAYLLSNSTADSPSMNQVFRAAVAQESPEAAALMLKTVRDRITVNLDDMLHEAAARGNSYMCELLLKHDAKPTVSRGDGTPLHYAVKWNDPKLARMFIEHGADVHAKNWQGQTPITLAPVGKAWTVGVIGALLDAGANAQDGDNLLVREAAGCSDLPLLKLLHERGGDLKCCDHRGKDLLEIARRGHESQQRLDRPDNSDKYRETLVFLNGEMNKPQLRKQRTLGL